MNIKEVINAWATAFNPTEEQKATAEERLKVCGECPHRKTIAGVGLCSKCLCPINKKIFSDNPTCPQGKWF
jgi:hypothetical protein